MRECQRATSPQWPLPTQSGLRRQSTVPARYEHGLAIAIGDRVSPLSTECAS